MRKTVFLMAALPLYCLAVGAAYAQSFVFEGKTDCARATNGRTYCRQVGSSSYSPVPEEFFSRFEAARTGKAPPSPVIVQERTTTNNVVVVNLIGQAADIKGQINLLKALLREQEQIIKAGGDTYVAAEAAKVIQERLKALQDSFKETTSKLAKYETSIRPDDGDAGITARKESEIQTKIPYYIPGTTEAGEFWVEPIVSDTGALLFNFRFVDVSSGSADKTRSVIRMTPGELEQTKAALVKAAVNAQKAHEKKLRRRLDVRLACFPMDDCPPEGKKVAEKASTEILFSLFDDGSTGARIQRNKGLYEEGYNVSIGSALLLQSYINHVLLAGKAEFEAGSATDEQLRDLFK